MKKQIAIVAITALFYTEGSAQAQTTNRAVPSSIPTTAPRTVASPSIPSTRPRAVPEPLSPQRGRTPVTPEVSGPTRGRTPVTPEVSAPTRGRTPATPTPSIPTTKPRTIAARDGSSTEGQEESTLTDSRDLQSLVISPNPTKDVVTINNFSSDPITQYTIISGDGRILSDEAVNGTERISIDLATFGKGIYLLRFKSANSEATKRVLVE